LCTLTAPQNLTLSLCEKTLWTAWGVSEHHYGILAVSIPIYYESYLFQKWRNVKLWIKKSVGYQCSRSPAIPPSCFPVCEKISCVGFKSFVAIRADAFTLHFEESAGTNIIWSLLPVKHQYHSTYHQSRHNVFIFTFVQHWTCHLKIFILFVHCSFMWHCWHGICCTKLKPTFFQWDIFGKVLKINCLCLTECISFAYWNHLHWMICERWRECPAETPALTACQYYLLEYLQTQRMYFPTFSTLFYLEVWKIM
jgi:hypothetical protein